MFGNPRQRAIQDLIRSKKSAAATNVQQTATAASTTTTGAAAKDADSAKPSPSQAANSAAPAVRSFGSNGTSYQSFANMQRSKYVSGKVVGSVAAAVATPRPPTLPPPQQAQKANTPLAEPETPRAKEAAVEQAPMPEQHLPQKEESPLDAEPSHDSSSERRDKSSSQAEVEEPSEAAPTNTEMITVDEAEDAVDSPKPSKRSRGNGGGGTGLKWGSASPDSVKKLASPRKDYSKRPYFETDSLVPKKTFTTTDDAPEGSKVDDDSAVSNGNDSNQLTTTTTNASNDKAAATAVEDTKAPNKRKQTKRRPVVADDDESPPEPKRKRSQAKARQEEELPEEVDAKTKAVPVTETSLAPENEVLPPKRQRKRPMAKTDDSEVNANDASVSLSPASVEKKSEAHTHEPEAPPRVRTKRTENAKPLADESTSSMDVDVTPMPKDASIPPPVKRSRAKRAVDAPAEQKTEGEKEENTVLAPKRNKKSKSPIDETVKETHVDVNAAGKQDEVTHPVQESTPVPTAVQAIPPDADVRMDLTNPTVNDHTTTTIIQMLPNGAAASAERQCRVFSMHKVFAIYMAKAK